MSEIQNIEAFEAQVLEIKKERKRCEAKTLKNLEKLYRVLNGHDEDSEEETERQSAALAEPVPQV